MSFKYFINYLRSKVKIDIDCENALKVRVKEIEVRRGTTLLYPGDLCKYLYFVKSGFFRVYTSDGFQDETIDFATTDQFITAIDGFFKQRIGNEGIVCEEGGFVIRISFYDWMSLEDLSPTFISLGRIILQESLLELNSEKNLYRLSNSREKYLHLLERYPNIENAVSQKHIASYLGITAPSLSTLLREMFRKPK